jgi:hypothetical protein
MSHVQGYHLILDSLFNSCWFFDIIIQVDYNAICGKGVYSNPLTIAVKGFCIITYFASSTKSTAGNNNGPKYLVYEVFVFRGSIFLM